MQTEEDTIKQKPTLRDLERYWANSSEKPIALTIKSLLENRVMLSNKDMEIIANSMCAAIIAGFQACYWLTNAGRDVSAIEEHPAFKLAKEVYEIKSKQP